MKTTQGFGRSGPTLAERLAAEYSRNDAMAERAALPLKPGRKGKRKKRKKRSA